MAISFEIPPDIEHGLGTDGADLEPGGEGGVPRRALSARPDPHHQLAEALGLDRYETDGVLKRHKVSPVATAEEIRSQAAALRDASPR